ncbi:hypothetical protein OPV22_034876 [Ensete ventricosum]|uniref:Uncharacterized protein n=1 Tax=Ensete ventricosum TaxID=4639 RepID=A0AAV8P0K8_ENSVE|nr:hypothetical protein OPV22_034876 [Ensete ventricosum]
MGGSKAPRQERFAMSQCEWVAQRLLVKAEPVIRVIGPDAAEGAAAADPFALRRRRRKGDLGWTSAVSFISFPEDQQLSLL